MMGQNETVSSTTPATPQIATLGGGCFWCLDAVFESLKGVEQVVSGYAGGTTVSPSYEQVCSGTTGHAEVVQVTFDPEAISYQDLLNVFFATHDPTTENRQGADIGTQYRSVILAHTEEQRAQALATIKTLNDERIWPRPIVTQVVPFGEFYPAEAYHQKYFRAHPEQGYCAAVVAPKVGKFRQKFVHLLKSDRHS